MNAGVSLFPYTRGGAFAHMRGYVMGQGPHESEPDLRCDCSWKLVSMSGSNLCFSERRRVGCKSECPNAATAETGASLRIGVPLAWMRNGQSCASW